MLPLSKYFRIFLDTDSSHSGALPVNPPPANSATVQRKSVLAAVEAYEQSLFRYARRLLGDDERARDVVQHTFLKLCDQNPDELKLGPLPWLFRVCRNRAIDLIREGGTARIDSGSATADLLASLASREPDPAEAAERNDLCRVLRQLIKTLPDLQREVVQLWSEGLGYREIAEVIDQRESYIRVLAHRALRSLKEHPQVKAWVETSLAPP